MWEFSASPLKLRYLEKYAVGSTALDIGTGAGHYARALVARGYDVVGLDVEPRKHAGYGFVQARLRAIPFKVSFDTVLAFDVLEHETDEAMALRELRRVTGKRLLLSAPNADDRLLVPYNLTFKHHIDKTHEREYFESELYEKLQSAGFRILHLSKEGPVRPAIIAEFMPVAAMRTPARIFVKALYRLRLLKNSELMADLYAVCEPK